jgi:hypothetical protein
MAAIEIVRLGINVLCDCLIKKCKNHWGKKTRPFCGTDVLGIQRPSSNKRV